MKFRKGKQTADRIERRQRGPWPGQDHDEKRQRYPREGPQRGDGRKTQARATVLLPGQADNDRQTEIDKQQQTKASHSKSCPREDTERCDVDDARQRHLAKDADEKQRCRRHGGGERNVLGVVEHGAVPCAANCKGHSRDQTRARTRNQSRRRCAGGYPANPRHGAKDMTQFVGISRNDIGERHDNNVEQSAVEVKISGR